MESLKKLLEEELRKDNIPCCEKLNLHYCKDCQYQQKGRRTGKGKTMTKNSVKIEHHQTFESLRQEKNGCEFWNARKLAKVLEYSEYRHFLPVVEKAKKACKNSGQDIMDHFEDILEMIHIGKGGQRQVTDIKLSRYACYLIVQNGDPSKRIIANGQTYFAIQTRRQELSDNVTFQQLKEEEKRLFLKKRT